MLKDLLTAPTEKLGKWGRFVVFQVKLWPQCLKLLRKNRCGTQAAALAYHTIFGIVPLAIIMIMVFQLFPTYRDVGENVKEFFYKQAHLTNIKYVDSKNPKENIKLTDQIDRITDRFVSNLNAGTITVFSGVIVIWAALALLSTIERSFNNIWKVGQNRNFLQRIINYWAILTLGPLLLGFALFLSTRFLVINGFESGIFSFLRQFGPFLISIVAMFLLYYVMPNTKVNALAALWSAVIASLIWTAAKFGFRAYVVGFLPQKAIYGVMGIIPLSVLWIYITWLIVLFGLQLAFATQHLSKLTAEEMAEMRKHDDYFIANDFSVIRILSFILEEFERHSAPVPSQLIFSRLNIPADFGDKVLARLVEEGLLCRTSEPVAGYLLAADGNNITLADISDAVAKASYAQDKDNTSEKLKAIINEHHNNLSRHTLMQILDQSTHEETES